ncbi:MAG: ASCH domain-containing protein [Planctomycetia bacterium]|nr:ASCH domain-containing protein [Planctomycetia bacterium]
MLLFKKKYLDAIRAGEKTQTVRLWKHRRMKPGQRSYIPGAGYIHVDTVDEVELANLTDDDARRDGFATAELLRCEIVQLYREQLTDGYRAYRVTFHTVDRCDVAADPMLGPSTGSSVAV